MTRRGNLVLAGVALLLFCLYLRQAATIWVSSDGASNALQAWDMLHGNVLLHGWWLSDVPFYTTELPEYMLVEAVRGLNAADIRISAAITYTLLVILTGLLAAGPASQEGPENRPSVHPRLTRGLLAAGIVLAPSSVLGTPMLISSPDHAGTSVPLMATLLLIDRLAAGSSRVALRAARLRWPVPLAAGVLLAWVQVADQVGLFAGAIPVAIVSGIRFAGRRERQDLALVIAALASIPASLAVLSGIRALGGFSVAPVTSRATPLLAPLSQLPAHARVLAQAVAVIFGANYFGQPSTVLRIIAIAHLAGLALVIAGLVTAGCLAARRRLDRVSGMLAAAIIILLAAGLLGSHLANILAAREITVVAPFGAALAGRMLGDVLSRVTLRANRPHWGLHWGRLLLGAGLAASLAFLAYDGSLPRNGPDGQPVADWLAAHHMGDGVAGYWQADVMTLASGGRVTVAPIDLSSGSAYHWEAKDNWFDPAQRYATYAISPPGPIPLTSPARPRALFGPPAAIYHVDGWIIQVWHRNLLVNVGQATDQRGS